MKFQKSLFQFPSNGKVLLDPGDATASRVDENSVSIPFKRESPFGHWKLSGARVSGGESVSIPFKRESPFGLTGHWRGLRRAPLVSIPFKRESPFGRSCI